MIIFRMFVLFFYVAENIRKMRFENRGGENKGLGFKQNRRNKTFVRRHEKERQFKMHHLLSVGRPAYIYILKGATTGLICSTLLCRIATVQIILTSPQLQMCYHDCHGPKMGKKKQNIIVCSWRRMQGEWKTGGICNHRAKI